MALSRESRVGAFVLAGLAVGGLVIFMIGDEKRLFDRKDAYKVSFSDVQGLKPGAPVRLGGIDIGTVSGVGHGPDATDDRLFVTLEIVRSEAGRIRQDTVARIGNKGLLGDKMIELAGGTPGRPSLPAGSVIKGEDPQDFSSVMAQVGPMAKHAEAILSNLEVTSGAIADGQTRDDLKASAHSINLILREVAEGEGYAHRLLADKSEAERMSRAVASLEGAAGELRATIVEARRTLQSVNDGPGLAHEVLRGKDGKEALAQATRLAGELADTLKGVRDGDGLAHAVVYGGSEQARNLSADLAAITGDVRVILDGVREGKGTIGGLLVDPSVYEDMKRVLGNVERNDVLRALVRYSIKEDEKKPTPKVEANTK